MMDNMSFDELQQIVSVCLDEIIKLKTENEELKSKLVELDSSNNTILEAVSSISKAIINAEKTNEIRYDATLAAIDNVKYEISSSSNESVWYPVIAEIDDTINEIVNERKSIARFGDGEFAIMSGYIRHGFQEYDASLAMRLNEVIGTQEEKFLIGIGDTFGNLEKYNLNSKQEIRAYMTLERRKEILSFLNRNRIYHNAYITRPYAMYADNTSNEPQKRFNKLKRIWNDRNVIIVEGVESRIGVMNDLFDNAKSIKRIEAPATNAYSKYDKILCSAKRNATNEVLFLIALGPTAGVLAYDLFKSGFQAIDLGHLDLEYEWMLNGSGGRCEVKHKYNNEYPNGNIVDNIDDKKYISEIIETIL